MIFADRLMGLGFNQACQGRHLVRQGRPLIPASKEKLIAKTTDEVKEYEQQYQDGLITAGEKYNKVVDAWSRCTDAVSPAR